MIIFYYKTWEQKKIFNTKNFKDINKDIKKIKKNKLYIKIKLYITNININII